MKLLYIILGLFQALLSKLFPFGTYKGVISTQIKMYGKIRRKYPDVPENEVLNLLIISRIESPPHTPSREAEYLHYKPLLEDPDKTLHDVMWEIVDWEFITSRKQYIYDRLFKMGASPLEIITQMNAFDLKVKDEIEKQISQIKHEHIIS